MAIQFDPQGQMFYLHTKSTTYAIGVLREKYLLHLYYGKRISAYPDFMAHLPIHAGTTWMGTDLPGLDYSTEALPMEYPTYGSADLRTPAFHAEYETGSAVTCLAYCGYEIYHGKESLSGLPATYVESESEADTLEITLADPLTGLKIILSYSVFEDYDIITKCVRAVNESVQPIDVQSILSSTTYLFDKNYEFVHLTGAWARERHIQKQPLMNGTMQIDSKRVASGHIHSPFLALARPWATENQGEVYGYSFVYSGNFIMQAETNQQNLVRVNIGINPFGFHWLLEPGEVFQAPEVVMTFSNSGFGTMSRRFHRLYRQHLCRGKYRDIERPVLINNWEATYFDFNEEKILAIAEKARDVGIELMVLDDGWFGKRNSDNCSLGDWTPNPEKLPNGIDGLAKKVTQLGMRFGLWFEPEMVSEDSDLYRAHPDWCIHISGRNKTPARNQLVLDLSRQDVCDYIVDSLSKILSTANVSYVKWDMNRNITESGSAALPANRQQELPHRYMLGLYRVLERLVTAFPDVLFEGCSGGGGRFDAGMLYYFPQYWTSDDTDAIERLYIQHGTSLVMPACTMGAHVSAVPNHQVHRTTPLRTRGHIAITGQFGYEMDLGKLSEEETELVRQQIRQYKEIRSTIHFGDLYRLRSPFEGENTAWEYVSADRKQVVLVYCTIRAHVLTGLTQLRFAGLDENAQYRNTETGEVYGGDFLMNVGLYLPDDRDHESRILIFEQC